MSVTIAEPCRPPETDERRAALRDGARLLGRLREDQRSARRPARSADDLLRREVGFRGKVTQARVALRFLGPPRAGDRRSAWHLCEPAGEATIVVKKREPVWRATEHSTSGANALKMRGGKNYDFSTDPPPDLAIEVEASHSADEAMEAWGAGVPEVWRFEAASFTCSFWRRPR